MNIEYKSYMIKLVSEYERFDLFKKVMRVNKSTQEEYESTKDLGYAMTMQACVERIIHEELRKEEEVIQLEEFLKNYIKERNELLTKIKK